MNISINSAIPQFREKAGMVNCINAFLTSRKTAPEQSLLSFASNSVLASTEVASCVDLPLRKPYWKSGIIPFFSKNKLSRVKTKCFKIFEMNQRHLLFREGFTPFRRLSGERNRVRTHSVAENTDDCLAS